MTTTRLALVMHQRETRKTTSTGPLALAMLKNSLLFEHGVMGSTLDLNHIDEPERRLMLLFPSDTAQPLTEELVRADPRPVTLVVVDGNWRQASRAARRIAGLERAQPVFLDSGEPTQWGIRTENKPGGLATFEAIARSLGILEGPDVREAMERVFHEMVRRQKERMPYLSARSLHSERSHKNSLVGSRDAP